MRRVICGGHAGVRVTCTVLVLLWNFAVHAAPPARPEKETVLWEHLASRISDIEHHLDGVLGVAILDLDTRRMLLIHPDEVFPQASSIKITVLAELYRQSAQAAQGVPHNAALSDTYIVRAADLVPDSDIMGGLTPGVTTLTNRDLATMMVAVSDNAATNVLIDRVGMDNVQRLMQNQGLSHTLLRRKMMDLRAAAEGRENVSTPREMMAFLENIYRQQIFGGELLKDFFTVLATHKDSWIPVDLPEGLRIANKPGALEGVRADSGIVFLANRPYVICVMTTYLGNERAGEDAIRSVSRAAYDMFARLSRSSGLGRVISPYSSNGR